MVSSGFSSFTDSVSRDSHFLMGGGDVVNSFGSSYTGVFTSFCCTGMLGLDWV